MNLKVVDLRSDTVTRPTPGMRRAMADAEVGDDVFGDDPTVLRLQAEVAERFGKEAALFVPSGTMANQIALLCYCRPGDHVIVPHGAHVVHYEGGGGAAIAGVQFAELGEDGIFELQQLVGAIQPDDPHCPPTRLVTVENTHNRSGGLVVPDAHIVALSRLLQARGLPLHMDGARFFNAVAAGADLSTVSSAVDSLSFCLSKGLGAPVGSMLVGSREFTRRALRYRKMMGGGMRQVGVLAAAGLHALHHHVERLAEDHRRAKRLAVGLAAIDHLQVSPGRTQTNMVFFQLDAQASIPDAQTFVRQARERGLLCHATGPRRVRLVTHLDVDDADIEHAIAVTHQILES